MLIRANLVFFVLAQLKLRRNKKWGGLETKRLQTFEQNVDEFVFGVAVVAVVVVTVVSVVVGFVTVVVIIAVAVAVAVAVVIFEQILPH